MTSSRHSRRTAGFSLSEVLIAVAILAVLTAVAIPNVFALRQSMRMTEVDAAARSIFSATQDNLSGMKAASTLPSLELATKLEQPVSLSAEPAPNDVTGQLRYLTSKDSLMATLLPNGAVEPQVQAGSYVILFNQTFGMALEVWYSETQDLAMQTEQVFDAWRGDTGAAARRQAGVGYYAGGDVSEPELSQLPKPELTIKDNAVTGSLTAEIYLRDLAQVWTKADLILTLASADGKSTLEIPVTRGAANVTVGSDGDTASVLIDSLAPGKQLKTLYPALADQAGKDLTFTLTVKPKGDTNALSQSVTANYNSLFASVENGAARIGNARHLQNLNAAFSGLTSAAAVTGAVQTAEILWPTQLTQTFVPINNETLTSYDGRNHPIAGLRITSELVNIKTAVGLFSVVPLNTTLKDIVLLHPWIEANYRMTAVGGLVGSMHFGTIENCVVRAFTAAERAQSQYAPYKDSPCAISLKKTNDPKPTMPVGVGGLGGSIANTSVRNCAAALPLLSCDNSNSYIGGLVSTSIFSNVYDSYAAVDQMTGDAMFAAGFIGFFMSGGTVERCYAVGNISVSVPKTNTDGQTVDNISGFLDGQGSAAFPNDILVRNSYCAMTYLDKFGKVRDVRPSAFVRLKSVTVNCAYLDFGTQKFAAESLEKAKALSYDALRSWAPETAAYWLTMTRNNSFPFDSNLDGQSYPFLGLNNIGAHYGSWPTMAGTAAYYEVYADGGFGLQLRMPENQSVNTLRYGADAPTISEAGYGVLLEGKRDKFTATGYCGAEKLTSADVKSPRDVTVGGKPYTFFPFDDEAMQMLRDAAMINEKGSSVIGGETGSSLSVGGAETWINPFFAASACDISLKGGLGVQGQQPYQIRTVGQLSDMRRATKIGNAVKKAVLFVQTHNLNASSLAASIQSSISDYQTFTGNYNAVQYTITGLRVPLVSMLYHGTVRAVQLEAANVIGSGIFAGVNYGTIADCTVTASALQAQSIGVMSGSAGGFVGDNLATGTIQNCHVIDTMN